MPAVFQFILLALAVVGVLALIVLFLPKPKFLHEEEPNLSYFPPPAEDRVFVVHFVDGSKLEILLAQIQVGPQFVAFHRGDGTLVTAHATNSIQSITEK